MSILSESPVNQQAARVQSAYHSPAKKPKSGLNQYSTPSNVKYANARTTNQSQMKSQMRNSGAFGGGSRLQDKERNAITHTEKKTTMKSHLYYGIVANKDT